MYEMAAGVYEARFGEGTGLEPPTYGLSILAIRQNDKTVGIVFTVADIVLKHSLGMNFILGPLFVQRYCYQHIPIAVRNAGLSFDLDSAILGRSICHPIQQLEFYHAVFPGISTDFNCHNIAESY